MKAKNEQENEKKAPALDLEEIVGLTRQIGLEYAEAREESERLDLLKATARARAIERYDDGHHTEVKLRRLGELDEDVNYPRTWPARRQSASACGSGMSRIRTCLRLDAVS